MNLIDVVRDIDNIDEMLIIFQQAQNDYKSDVFLSNGGDSNNGVKEVNGKKYYYLLEVFLAKEFVEDWLDTLTYLPGPDEVAKRLHEYAINDA